MQIDAQLGLMVLTQAVVVGAAWGHMHRAIAIQANKSRAAVADVAKDVAVVKQAITPLLENGALKAIQRINERVSELERDYAGHIGETKSKIAEFDHFRERIHLLEQHAQK